MPQDAIAPLDEAFLAELDKQLDQSRHLDVLQTATDKYGPYPNWAHPKLIVLAARCLVHLGQPRRADALILRAWRRHPQDVGLTLARLRVMRRRSGLLDMLAQLRAFGAETKLTPQEQNKLTLLEVDVLTQFRDFDRAEQRLGEARDALDKDDYLTEVALIALARDDMDGALEAAQAALALKPDNRYGLQLCAHTLNLRGATQEGLALLEPHQATLQSSSLLEQMFHLALELGQHAKAEQQLNDLTRLLPESTQETQRTLNVLRADLLCAQQNYEQALPLLEQQRAGYWKSIAASIRSTQGSGARRVLDVPYVKQGHMTCAPASITAVARYWGTDYDQEAVIAAICYDGTPAVAERQWLQAEGWTCIEFDLRQETAQALIDRGLPILLQTVEPGSAHLQVLAGYDLALGTYLLRDSNHPRLNPLLIDSAQEYYASSGPRAMLMLPPDKVSAIDGLEFEAREHYDHYYQISRALEQSDRSAAFTHYRRLLSLDAEHRLTLWAQRDLAAFDHDAPGNLHITEALLQRYPADVNLQMAKVGLLSVIGSTSTMLAYLQSVDRDHDFQFLMRSRLAAELRSNPRQRPQAEKLLIRLQRIDPLHAPTLYAYAGVLWAKGERRQSYEIYRFLTCLEDKAEGYAESYFKAARHFNETELALAHLRARYRDFHAKSSGPAISLFNALCSLEREQEGLELLAEAVAARPDDGELLLFCAHRKLEAGDLEGAQALLDQAEGAASTRQLLECRAQLHTAALDRPNALKCWQQLLAHEPLSRTANEAVLQLHQDMGEPEQALHFIDAQLAKYPGNYTLLCCKQAHLAGNPDQVEERMRTLHNLIEHHSDNSWAYSELADCQVMANRFNDALVSAQTGVTMDDDAEAHCRLGEVYVARQELDAARISFRQAIARSCDEEVAQQQLLSCVFDVEDVKHELGYIREQLLAQVSFGAGILKYQTLAARWLSPQEQESFLRFALQERADLWQSWVALARFQSQQAQLQPALETLQSSRERFPLLPVLCLEIADIHSANGDLHNAEQALREAQTLSPGWTVATRKLADVLELLGRMPDAISCIKGAIQRAPSDYTNHGYLADLQWKLGQRQEAVVSLRRALTIEPCYEWAWQKLNDWSQEVAAQGQTEDDRINQIVDVKAEVTALRAQQPNNEALLVIHTRIEKDTAKRAQLLLDFLQTHPLSTHICHRAVDALLELEQYDKALFLCDTARWPGGVPNTIEVARAEVLQASGRLSDALALVQTAVEQDPNLYEGWRLLALWHEQKGEPKKVLAALEQCLKIHPNDANVLCFVAEKMQQHQHKPIGCKASGERRKDISRMLQRAFQVQPNDAYIGLTYIDELLDHEEYDRARAGLERLKRFHNDVFVTYRELRLACEPGGDSNDKAAVPALWRSIVQSADANDWIAYQSWQQVKRIGWELSAAEIIDEYRTQGEFVCPLFGEYLGYHHIETQGFKAYCRQLEAATLEDIFLDRQLEACLRTLLDQTAKVPASLRAKYDARIKADMTNRGLMGNILIQGDLWYEARNWYQGIETEDNLQPWSLYLASFTARQLSDWETGVRLIAIAHKLEPDNYRDDIEVSYHFDQWLAGNPTDLACLQWIQKSNLSSISAHQMCLLEAMQILADRNPLDCADELKPTLRQARQYYQENRASMAAVYAQQQVQKRFKAAVRGSGLKRVIGKLRVGLWF